MKRIGKRIVLGLLLLLFLIIGNKLLHQYFDSQPTPRISGFEIHGIDVSHHQNKINWNAVKKDSIDFVFMKATEGENFLDPRFKKNWRKAQQKKFIRGAYHFYRPSVSPMIQARHFIKNVHLRSGDFPPVLDLEVTDNRPKQVIINEAKEWLKIIEAHYGIKPIIYTNRNWFKRYIDGNFDNYIIWMAAYTTSPRPELANNKPWHFWQYTNRGRIKGIEGAVDMNVFHGSDAELKMILIP